MIGSDRVQFSLLSEDGSGGFPGRVRVKVTYTLDAHQNALHIDYEAWTTKPTPLDLTNHVFFNLDGANSIGTIGEHLFKINANQVVRAGDVVDSVEATQFDFREFVRLSSGDRRRRRQIDVGDNSLYFILDQQSGMKYAAS